LSGPRYSFAGDGLIELVRTNGNWAVAKHASYF